MVVTRRGTRTDVTMPGVNKGIPGHFSLIPDNNRRISNRELNGLGLLDAHNNITQQAKDAIIPPINMIPDNDQLYFDITPDMTYCDEILRKDRIVRQCRNRPLTGQTKCRHHGQNTRTQRTARRQTQLDQDLTNRRNAQQQRRQNERQKMVNSTRFGRPSRRPIVMPPVLLATQTAVLHDWTRHATGDQVTRWLTYPGQDFTDEARRLFHHRDIPRYFDRLERQRLRGMGRNGDFRPRCLDLAVVRGGPQNEAVALFHKCTLCHKFEYPVPTSIVPEMQTMKCSNCDTRVHRHCQESVPVTYHDSLYLCPHC